jgi:ElaB/YqjD/DUF883 family membrane-anchored ribosome-binding protein
MAATLDPLAPAAANTQSQSGDGMTDSLKSKVSDATSHLRHTAGDFGRSAAENINKNLKSAASALDSTASALRRAPNTGGKLGTIAHSTAGRLEAGAQYMRTHDTQDLVRGIESYTRSQPAVALGCAAAVGFLIGMSLQRDRRY